MFGSFFGGPRKAQARDAQGMGGAQIRELREAGDPAPQCCLCPVQGLHGRQNSAAQVTESSKRSQQPELGTIDTESSLRTYSY